MYSSEGLPPLIQLARPPCGCVSGRVLACAWACVCVVLLACMRACLFLVLGIGALLSLSLSLSLSLDSSSQCSASLGVSSSVLLSLPLFLSVCVWGGLLSCFLCILLSSLAFLRVHSDLLSACLLAYLLSCLLTLSVCSLLVLSLFVLSGLSPFGALGRSRLFGRTLILRVLAL